MAHRVLLVDHGLTARTGHHFDFCLVLARLLLARRLEVAVFGHAEASGDVHAAFEQLGASFHAAFSNSPYSHSPQAGSIESRWEALLHRTIDEMSPLRNGDLCLLPTLTPEHLWAWASLPSPPPLAGLIHYDPNQLHPLGGRTWRRGCDLISTRGLEATLGAIDPVIAGFVRTYSGSLPILDMPYPLKCTPRSSYSDSLGRIGFFGHQREERGLRLLVPLVKELVALGFEVVLHDTRGRFQEQGALPRLRLIPNFVEDLEAELNRCDLVVCPMDRTQYIQRLSGVVNHAVACGIPFVLPAGTLSALRFQGSGACAPYAEHSVEGILASIREVASGYPRFANASAALAREWNRTQGGDAFLEAALGRFW